MATGFQGYSQPQSFSPQFFPQSQGNVYLINNSLEVANVPISAGVSVAICMSEEMIYLKSMQNGNPLFMAYKISPYVQETPQARESELKEILKDLSDRLGNVESQLKKTGGKLNELV
jgi:hypothetical protein